MGELTPIQSVVRFDAATHTYTDEAGNRLPSVTQVLKGAGLIETEWYTLEAAERGTAVHLACALYDDGVLDRDTVDPVCLPYLEAWEAFRRDSGAEMIRVEHRVRHPHYLYAGTLDRTVLIGGKPYVLDIKSGHCQPWAAIQTAAYAACLSSRHARMAVELRADSTYRVYHFHDRNDFNVFTAALAVYNWRSNHG